MVGVKIEALFQEFWKKNIEQVSKLENLRDYLKTINTKTKIDSSEFTEKILNIPFIKASPTDTHKLYEALLINGNALLEVLDQFIDHLKAETDSLKKYFDSLDFEDISSLKEFDSRAQAYNQFEVELMTKLHSKTSEIFKLETKLFSQKEKAYQIEHSLFENTAKQALRHYADLYLLITSKGSKVQVLSSLIILIEYLNNYEKQYVTLSKSYADAFIEASKEHLKNKTQVKKLFSLELSGDNLSTFKEHYFLLLRRLFSNSTLNITLVSLKPFIDKLSWQQGKINTPYEQANEDNKLDKLLKEVLNSLFEGIDFYTKKNGSEKKTIKELAVKITEVGDKFKEVEDGFKDAYETLLSTKFAEKLSFSYDKKPEDMAFIVDGMDNEMTFKDFKKDMLKEEEHKDIVKAAQIYLSNLINSDSNKDPFKTFKKRQEDLGILKSKSEDNDDELWEKSESISDSNIVPYFQEAKSMISDKLITISEIINEESNFQDGGQLTQLAKESINQTRVEIVEILKGLGKNLETYCQREGLEIEPIEKELKDLIRDKWLKVSFTLQAINSVIISTQGFLEKIK